jgi:trk system potassium uptake protein TrkA
MRAVILGASTVGLLTARRLLEDGHEVVIIERDQDWIDSVSEDLDCGFLLGDGSRPAVLQEVGPESTDILFAVSDSDQDNIIGSLVARSLGIDRVVTGIKDPDFEGVCRELGLEDTIVPDRELARALSEMAAGVDRAPLAGALEKGLRFFTVVVKEQQHGPIAELELPEQHRIIAVTRDGNSRLADADTEVQEKDRILLVVHEDDLETLKKRFERPE